MINTKILTDKILLEAFRFKVTYLYSIIKTRFLIINSFIKKMFTYIVINSIHMFKYFIFYNYLLLLQLNEYNLFAFFSLNPV